MVTSSELVNAVNRSSRTLAFRPFVAPFGKRISGHDEVTYRIIQCNLHGSPDYYTDIHDGSVASLAPGPDLERITEAMLSKAAIFLIPLEGEQGIGLFAWIRHVVTICSTEGIYGPDNPLSKDSGRLVQTFWYAESRGIRLVEMY